MSNVITDIGHDVKVAAVDTAKVVVKTVDFLPHAAAAVLATALKDEPQLKATVLALIEAGSKVIADGTIAVASKGTNLLEDAATVSDAESFFAYFNSTFIPAVASLYHEVRADLH